jgi:hypothetical protein
VNETDIDPLTEEDKVFDAEVLTFAEVETVSVKDCDQVSVKVGEPDPGKVRESVQDAERVLEVVLLGVSECKVEVKLPEIDCVVVSMADRVFVLDALELVDNTLVKLTLMLGVTVRDLKAENDLDSVSETLSVDEA